MYLHSIAYDKTSKDPSQKVMNFSHLLSCETIVTRIFGGKFGAPTQISESNFVAKPPYILI